MATERIEEETVETEGSVGLVETQSVILAEPPDELELDSGRKLGPITVAFETYGEPNADKSNAVLIVHALSGDAHAAGRHAPDDRRSGWWDDMIGPGKAFDTTKYWVICSNVIGGCMGSTGPKSTDPATGRPYGLHFPIVTIGDMVRAQVRLIEYLGIETLHSVAGGSMGGMQTLEWVTSFPDRVRSGIVIAAAPYNGAQAIAFDAVGRHAILADRNFKNGDYYGGEPPTEGLSIARMLGHITYLSDESMRAKFGRALRSTGEYGYHLGSEFSVETYLDYKGEQFVNRFDANSYLYITKAIDYFDVAAQHGSLDHALAHVDGKLMILSYSSDWLYRPSQSLDMVHALMRQHKDVSYCNIQSNYGHDAFLLEVDVMKQLIGGYLDHVGPGKERAADQAPAVETPSEPPSEEYRRDYELIVELVEEGTRVLDVGCGDGRLLEMLREQNGVQGLGIELSQDNVVACVQRGVSVVQVDIEEKLSALPDDAFDYVILGMTLQVLDRPDVVLREMVRVGKKAIISVPNFGYWKVRAQLLLSGRAPVTPGLPYDWYRSPNRRMLSLRDFRDFCASHDTVIEQEIPLTGGGRVALARLWPNWLAEEAVYVVSSKG